MFRCSVSPFPVTGLSVAFTSVTNRDGVPVRGTLPVLRLTSLLAVTGLVLSVGMLAAPTADADMTSGNYQLSIPDRYDFHTWAWAISSCRGVPDCRYVYAIPCRLRGRSNTPERRTWSRAGTR